MKPADQSASKRPVCKTCGLPYDRDLPIEDCKDSIPNFWHKMDVWGYLPVYSANQVGICIRMHAPELLSHGRYVKAFVRELIYDHEASNAPLALREIPLEEYVISIAKGITDGR